LIDSVNFAFEDSIFTIARAVRDFWFWLGCLRLSI